MAISKYDAYSGDAEMPNGVTVNVRYLDREGVEQVFGRQPAGALKRKRIGWYWAPKAEQQVRAKVHGPFTSSRKAMVDALASNPEVSDEAA